ncbi:MAG: tetratricopeptide repeat protein [Crocinitomicaceae bacterium]|nr:tetratricopeptide repeat protein [Crocinitomicaceae bacterium]
MQIYKQIWIFFLFCSAVICAQESNDTPIIWDSLEVKWRQSYGSGMSYADQILLCNELYSIAQENQNIDQVLRSEQIFCQTFNRNGRSHLSFSKALKLEARYSKLQKTHYPNYHQYFLKILGDGYRSIDSLEKAVQYYQDIESIDTNINTSRKYNLALMLIDIGKPDSGIRIISEPIIKSKNNGDLIGLHNMRGLCHRKAGNYEKAIEDFMISIKYIDSSGSRKALKPVIYGNIGSCYRSLGDYERAYEFLTYDLEENLRIGNYVSATSAEMLLAEIDTINGNYNKAIKRYEDILQRNSFGPIPQAKGSSHLSLSILYGLIGNEKKSQEQRLLYEEFMKNFDLEKVAQQKNLENEINAANFESALKNSELEKENIENKLLVETNLRAYESSRSNYYLLIGALILVISFLIFSRSRARTKRSLELTEAREQIAASKAELAEKNNELLKLQISESEVLVNQVRYELDLKNSFSSRLVEYIKKNEFNISPQDLNALNLFINNELGHKSILSDYSEDVNLAFVSKLVSTYPNLTETELSLIALIVQNYSNKEIAVSRSMTIGSVKVAKNRIKKKMELSGEERLKDVLQKMIVEESGLK